MNATVREDSVASGLTDVLGKYEGIVCGGNDFLYTSHMEQHPCAYFLYRYGPLLASLGVDTIFLENHYISEPLQTRGFLGYVMYCAYRYRFRVIGLEFKGTQEEYKQYTGKTPYDMVTTIAYDERNRIVRLNMVADDIRKYQLHPSVWTKKKGRRLGKYILFCGMSHVNDERRCKGIKTLFNVPGIGVQFMDTTRWTKAKPFYDKEANYRRPTDYLMELKEYLPQSLRLHIDSTIYCGLHDYLFFYRAYEALLKQVGKKTSPCQLWRAVFHVYPMEYQYMLSHIVRSEPALGKAFERIPSREYEEISSIVMDQFTNICSRSIQRAALAGVTEEDLDHLTNCILLWVQKETGKALEPSQYPMVMDLIFLEKKKLDSSQPPDRWWSLLQHKFKKQRTRPEHHLFPWIHLMYSLRSIQEHGQAMLPIPKTRFLAKLYPDALTSNPQCLTQQESEDV